MGGGPTGMDGALVLPLAVVESRIDTEPAPILLQRMEEKIA